MLVRILDQYGGGKFSFAVKDILTCSFAYCWLARAPTKVRARCVRISLIYFVRKGTSERIELVLSLVLASWLCIFSVRGLFLVFRRPPQFFLVFSSSSRSENRSTYRPPPKQSVCSLYSGRGLDQYGGQVRFRSQGYPEVLVRILDQYGGQVQFRSQGYPDVLVRILLVSKGSNKSTSSMRSNIGSVWWASSVS